MISLKLQLESLAILISGLYISSKGIHIYAIPSELFYDVAVMLEEYLPTWDYSKISLEEWICKELLIFPRELLEDAESYKDNTIYVEKVVGRILYVITANVR